MKRAAEYASAFAALRAAIPRYPPATWFSLDFFNQIFSIRVHHADRDVAALIQCAALHVFRSGIVMDFP
jgi:hypothetical protein